MRVLIRGSKFEQKSRRLGVKRRPEINKSRRHGRARERCDAIRINALVAARSF